MSTERNNPQFGEELEEFEVFEKREGFLNLISLVLILGYDPLMLGWTPVTPWQTGEGNICFRREMATAHPSIGPIRITRIVFKENQGQEEIIRVGDQYYVERI
jgi:hypothetical protein